MSVKISDSRPNDKYKFEVLLSFADAEREYAKAIYEICKANGIAVYFDESFMHESWGRNLLEHLTNVYKKDGQYAVVLISESYRENVYTRVEARAALERTAFERSEYFLPVKVDGAWLEGLPEATGYLDLRTDGVLGICETILKKLSKDADDMKIPYGLHIPRVPIGYFSSSQLEKYLMKLCVSDTIRVFGVLLYDDQNVELKKLLRDQDYWDALDKVSGRHFEIFAARDETKIGVNENSDTKLMEMLTAESIRRSQNNSYHYSLLLKEYFGENKATLVYPSVLLFIVEKQEVKYCRLIPLSRGCNISEHYSALYELLSIIASVIDSMKEASSYDLWKQLKLALMERDEPYTLYIENAPTKAETAIHKLCA